MKKIRFLALSLVISASLCAAPDVELYNAVTRLQELALEELLRMMFPIDDISEVAKGVKGADVIKTQNRHLLRSIFAALPCIHNGRRIRYIQLAHASPK